MEIRVDSAGAAVGCVVIIDVFRAFTNPGRMPHFDFRFTSMHELVKTHQEQLRVK